MFLGLQLAKEINSESGPKLVDFKRVAGTEPFLTKVHQLRDEVQNYSSQFFIPGLPEI